MEVSNTSRGFRGKKNGEVWDFHQVCAFYGCERTDIFCTVLDYTTFIVGCQDEGDQPYLVCGDEHVQFKVTLFFPSRDLEELSGL